MVYGAQQTTSGATYVALGDITSTENEVELRVCSPACPAQCRREILPIEQLGEYQGQVALSDRYVQMSLFLVLAVESDRLGDAVPLIPQQDAAEEVAVATDGEPLVVSSDLLVDVCGNDTG